MVTVEPVRLTPQLAELAKVVRPMLPADGSAARLDLGAINRAIGAKADDSNIYAKLGVLVDKGLLVRPDKAKYARGPKTKIVVYLRSNSKEPLEIIDLADGEEPIQVPLAASNGHVDTDEPPQVELELHNGHRETAPAHHAEDNPVAALQALASQLEILTGRRIEAEGARQREVVRIEEAQARLEVAEAQIGAIDTELAGIWQQIGQLTQQATLVV